MPEFILLCRDKADALPVRMETRPAHLDYIASHDAKVLIAGPMLNDSGEPIGSMLVIQAEGRAAVQDFADNDPYAKAGLFQSVEITPYRLIAGDLLPESP